MREGLARPLVRAQRIGLAAGPVQRQHEEMPPVLPERLRIHHRREFHDRLSVMPEVELERRELLHRGEAQLGESCALVLGETPSGEVGEGHAAPETQCLAEGASGGRDVTVVARPSRREHELLEATGVDRLLHIDDSIPGRLRVDQRRPEPLAQSEYVVLDRLRCRAWWGVTPERFGQAVDADDRASLEEQRVEDHAFPRAPGPLGVTRTVDFQGSEDPEFHGQRVTTRLVAFRTLRPF